MKSEICRQELKRMIQMIMLKSQIAQVTRENEHYTQEYNIDIILKHINDNGETK